MGGVVTGNPNPVDEFATLPDLLRGLGHDVTDDAGISAELEDYVESYLYHDASVNLTDWSGDKSSETLTLDAEGVVMWTLPFPVTLTEFHDYLDELDLRIGRMRIVDEIPAPDCEEEDGAEKISAIIALLFGVEADRLRDDLGTSWTSIESEAVGNRSNPVAYICWADSLVVGLDDQYAYVFLTDADGDVLDANSNGVIWEAEWTREGVADYAGFARTLRESADSADSLSRTTET